MTPPKPNFIIIGSAKCGTTTLAGILENHPDCCFSRPKELYFFQERISPAARLYCQEIFPRDVYSPEDRACGPAGVYGPNPNLPRGWDWYRKAWSHYDGEPLIGEATPDYSDRTNSPRTASAIRAFNPEAKIIYMVREPLARMVSHWQMWHRLAQDGRDCPETGYALAGFESYMRLRPDRIAFWDETRYHYQLEPYLQQFGRERILVSFLEDWARDQEAEIRRIFHFLGIDPSRLDTRVPKAMNVGRELTRPSKLQRAIVQSGLRPILRGIVSDKAWARLSAKFGSVPYRPAVPELKLETLGNFLDYVRADNRLFLEEWGKPADYWVPPRLSVAENDIPKSDRQLVHAK